MFILQAPPLVLYSFFFFPLKEFGATVQGKFLSDREFGWRKWELKIRVYTIWKKFARLYSTSETQHFTFCWTRLNLIFKKIILTLLCEVSSILLFMRKLHSCVHGDKGLLNSSCVAVTQPLSFSQNVNFSMKYQKEIYLELSRQQTGMWKPKGAWIKAHLFFFIHCVQIY